MSMMQELNYEMERFSDRLEQLMKRCRNLEQTLIQRNMEKNALLEENQQLREQVHSLRTQYAEKIGEYVGLIDNVLAQEHSDPAEYPEYPNHSDYPDHPDYSDHSDAHSHHQG